MESGDHFCAFYQKEGRGELLNPVVRATLDAGETCLCLMPEAQSWGAQLRALSDEPIGTRLQLWEPDMLGTDDEDLTSDALLDFWETQVAAAALKVGVDHVRLIQDLTWGMDGPGVGVLIDYEDRLNAVCHEEAWASLCLYDLSRCSGESVLAIVRAHPLILVGTMRLENPYCRPSGSA